MNETTGQPYCLPGLGFLVRDIIVDGRPESEPLGPCPHCRPTDTQNEPDPINPVAPIPLPEPDPEGHHFTQGPAWKLANDQTGEICVCVVKTPIPDGWRRATRLEVEMRSKFPWRDFP